MNHLTTYLTLSMVLLYTVLSLPLPTPAQLRFHQNEISVLITFNMATFFRDGDPGCDLDNWAESQLPSSFSPDRLDTDQWIQVMKSFGAKSAVLTAKHGCGFNLWKTNVTYPNSDVVYDYTVFGAGGIQRDVLQEFVDSCKRHGIEYGFYYSLTNNFKLNVYHMSVQNTTLLPGQVRVTQDEFEEFAYKQIEELWMNYGDLGEIWLDGGYETDLKGRITNLLSKYQSDAAVWNGYGVSKNPIRWDGTESGKPSEPLWSTGCEIGGGLSI
eukprot:TRINITY_DN10801_c0_g1_i2.p1 TRINITY_DN10801_c0_g1~~TRINITY_DN10801_c0_g1_i2.p1  ORF type:complete len:276 (+),score=41.57 TRINITY_DN10801_c0_g1_i2:24-830(+)